MKKAWLLAAAAAFALNGVAEAKTLKWGAAREIASLDPDFTLERFTASRPYRDPASLKQLVEALLVDVDRVDVAAGVRRPVVLHALVEARQRAAADGRQRNLDAGVLLEHLLAGVEQLGQLGAELDEYLGCDTLAFSDEAEEDVLGTDVVVVEKPRFFLR